MGKFTSLDLHPALLRNLTDIGYTDMTLVQAETLPHMIGGWMLWPEQRREVEKRRLSVSVS